jgi:hypothetical protein
MEHVKKIWDDTISKNPIEHLHLEINLAEKLSDNIYSYSIPAPRFNEILADISLLTVWTDWQNGQYVRYFMNDMIMNTDAVGHCKVFIHKTLHQVYVPLPSMTGESNPSELNPSESNPSAVLLKNLPHNTNIRVHHDDRGATAATPATAIDPDTFPHSNLHIKCVRKIPLSPLVFPPYDKYHAIERFVYRYYSNSDLTVFFIINRPKDCLKGFDELLVNWHNSVFSIKVIIHNLHNATPIAKHILAYLGHS